jgi:predicted TPR repeat methyltransferase
MTNNFSKYAKYYDYFNLEKNYLEEATYVDSLIKKFNQGSRSILDIGCGTGLHDIALHKLGYSVVGIDISAEMIEIAKSYKNSSMNNLNFVLDSSQSYISHSQFDTVVSLFHVTSYQTNQSSLIKFFNLVRNNLKIGGIFIFDYWYTPAVQKLKPGVREKVVSINGLNVSRISIPETISKDLFKINITITDSESSFSEVHNMKSFNTNEFVKIKGFEVIDNFSWLSNIAPKQDNWSAVSVLRRIE